jgi:hypothetical protein
MCYSSNKLEMYIMAYRFDHTISSVNTWNHIVHTNNMEFLLYCKVLKTGLDYFVADYAVTSVVTCMLCSTSSAISFSGNLL